MFAASLHVMHGAEEQGDDDVEDSRQFKSI